MVSPRIVLLPSHPQPSFPPIAYRAVPATASLPGVPICRAEALTSTCSPSFPSTAYRAVPSTAFLLGVPTCRAGALTSTCSTPFHQPRTEQYQLLHPYQVYQRTPISASYGLVHLPTLRYTIRRARAPFFPLVIALRVRGAFRNSAMPHGLYPAADLPRGPKMQIGRRC